MASSELLDDARALVAAFLEGADAYHDLLLQIIGDEPDASARVGRIAEICMATSGLTAMYVKRAAEQSGCLTPGEVLHALATAVAAVEGGN